MSDAVNRTDKIDAEAKERARLNEEAERVMANSKPTPTQREADLIKEGLLHPDDKEDPGNPTMPSVAEQRKRVADAGASQPYRTRDMGAAQPQAARPAPATQAHSTTPSVNPATAGQHASSARHGASSTKEEDKK